ncbi:hypothetical protein [Paenibacillus sp. LjRoot153]|uniref:hypothetical protein n=1 Tax=Paenibacillus sp. LjRoot153 TaxID=3342270 RepID=UPI003F50885B
MQSLLSQLKDKKLKEIHTLDYSNGKYSNAKIISAENSLVNFTSNGVEHFVPMHLIAGLEIWGEDFDSKLIADKENSEKNDGDNNESSSMMNLFNPLVGKAKVDFNTLAEQLNDVSNAEVIGLNEGIVVMSTRDTVYVVTLSCISDVSNIKRM